MIQIILIILIIIVIFKILTIYFPSIGENFINITNPFVDGLSQAQLGADVPDDS